MVALINIPVSGTSEWRMISEHWDIVLTRPSVCASYFDASALLPRASGRRLWGSGSRSHARSSKRTAAGLRRARFREGPPHSELNVPVVEAHAALKAGSSV